MKKIIVFVIAAIILSGCATTSYTRTSKSNKKKLNQLSIGMPEDQVMDLMGRGTVFTEGMTVNNPYKTKELDAGSGAYEILYYVTDIIDEEDQEIDDDELTPLAFKNGELAGWGWGFLEKLD